jgi:hypothetical protein
MWLGIGIAHTLKKILHFTIMVIIPLIDTHSYGMQLFFRPMAKPNGLK